MKPVKKESPNDGVGLTWDDGAPLTTREGKAWWAGWNEGNIDGRADALDEMRDEIERLRKALRDIACAEGTCGCAIGGFKRDDCFHGIARAALGEGK